MRASVVGRGSPGSAGATARWAERRWGWRESSGDAGAGEIAHILRLIVPKHFRRADVQEEVLEPGVRARLRARWFARSPARPPSKISLAAAARFPGERLADECKVRDPSIVSRFVGPRCHRAGGRTSACRFEAGREGLVRGRPLRAARGMSVQHPAAFLLENPTKLYRDCLRLADFLAKKQGFPREALRAQVTAPWRRNQHEKDPETIMRAREAAVRGLSNYMMYEASKGAMDGAPVFTPEDEEGAEGGAEGK